MCVCVCVRVLICGTSSHWCTTHIVHFLLPYFTTKTWLSYTVNASYELSACCLWVLYSLALDSLKASSFCFSFSCVYLAYNTVYYPDQQIQDIYIYIYIYIYLLTAIGFVHAGSSTVHIYTQTIHRKTQLIWEQCGPCPVFASCTLAFALTTDEKAQENLSQGSRTMKTEYTEQNIHNYKNT